MIRGYVSLLKRREAMHECGDIGGEEGGEGGKTD